MNKDSNFGAGVGLFRVAALAYGSRLTPGSRPAHEPGAWADLTGSRGSPPLKGEPMSRLGTSVPSELLAKTCKVGTGLHSGKGKRGGSQFQDRSRCAFRTWVKRHTFSRGRASGTVDRLSGTRVIDGHCCHTPTLRPPEHLREAMAQCARPRGPLVQRDIPFAFAAPVLALRAQRAAALASTCPGGGQ